jgi:transcriptional regulator with XRE-family HTH domain
LTSLKKFDLLRRLTQRQEIWMTVVRPPRPAAESVDQLMAQVGAHIKQLRKDRGHTLDELAHKSGLSAGLISMLERGQGNPSFATLVQLAQALDLSVAQLFHTANSVDPVVRRDQRRPLNLHPEAPQSTSHAELLTPSLGHSVAVIWVEEPPGSSSAATPFQHSGEEVGVILEGRHRVWLDGVCHELSAGDAITFPSTIPHWYENAGTEPVKAIWIVSPPSF